jgi:ABC-type Fe3+-hydroxamate transport system substrate-binding protein
MKRVVSLVPSATETLIAWGVFPVAVTRFCEQGDRFPTVGGTKDPDVEAIVALAPDLVIMCDQENRLPDADTLTNRGVAVHAITITHVDHVAEQMIRLAEALGIDPTLGARCRPTFVEPHVSMRAYLPIWKRPWMSVNVETYAASLLSALGVTLVSADQPTRYPEFDLEQARAAGADVVLAPTEPYPFGERHRSLLETVAPTRFVDGRDLFWWGVRTPAASQRLLTLLTET